MKRKVLVLYCFALFLFWGCSRTHRNPASYPLSLTLADIHPSGYPTVIGAQEFAKSVAQRSGGRILISVLDGGVAGDETAVIEKIQFGKIDFGRVSISPLASFSPDLNVLMVPFEYRDDEHFWKVLDGSIGKKLLSGLSSSGFDGLCYYDSGARSFYSSRPIRRISDLHSLKIRVQESAFMMDFVTALGAVPVPLPYSDVISAFQNGTITVAENNIPSYESSGQYRISRYYLRDEHCRIPDILLASKKTMDQLSAADRKIIYQAAFDSVPVQRAAWSEYENSALQKVLDEGCIFFNLNLNDNKEEIQKAMTVVNRRLSSSELQLVKQIKNVW